MKLKWRHLLIALYATLFAYVACRACFLSFTYDESLSYLIFNGEPHIKGIANHHWLNTWLMQLFSYFLGDHEFALRLPNVIAFAFYIFYFDRILKRIDSPVVSAVTLPLLLLNPFILDFFSLARGYGLSLAMMAASLDHFFRFVSDEDPQQKTKHFSLSMLFAVLAFFANLSLINFTIAIFATGILHWLIVSKHMEVKFPPAILVVAGVSVALALGVDRLFFLKEKKELYFGTEDFNDTVRTLIEGSFYFSTYPTWFVEFLKKAFFILFPIGIVLVLLKRDWSSPFAIVSWFLLLLVSALYIEHRFFGALYPIGRAALYLLPLSALFIGLMIRQIFSYTPKLRAGYQLIPGVLLCGMALFHLGGKINLKHCFEWQYDANTKDAAMRIGLMKKTEGKFKVGATWLFVPSMKYYGISRQMNLEVVHWYCSPPLDALYTILANNPGEGWDELKNYPDTQSGLFKMKEGTVK